MEAVIVTALIGAFVCGGVVVEALAPLLPALLGLQRAPDATAARPAIPVSGRESHESGGLTARWVLGGEGHDRAPDLLELERRVEDLEAERDFYRSLAERSAPQSAARAPARRGGS